MIASRITTVVCLAAALSTAQTFNIRGTVKDNADAGISGATVKLEKAGLSTTTGADGSFVLAGTAGIRTAGGGRALAASPIRVSNGSIAFTLSDNAPVAISIHDIGGRQLYSTEGPYAAGPHAVRIPAQYAGILLYRVTIGSEAYSFKSSPFGGSAAGLAGREVGASALRKQAKASAVIADVISAVGEGYLNYRDSIKTSDTSGIVIKMIPNAGNVTDADGNVYQTVRIGNQVWTADNWRSTKFNDGTAIPLVTDGAAWVTLTTPGYCFYGNSTVAAEHRKWGALYNWYAVNMGKLAPAGWHVPTDVEWDTLRSCLVASGYNWDGTTARDKIAKSLATKTDWAPDTTAGMIGEAPGRNDATGFSALPGGFRYYAYNGSFNGQSYDGIWWTATETNGSCAYYRSLCYRWFEYLGRNFSNQQLGSSVRFLRD